MQKEQAKERIGALVQKYERLKSEGRIKSYNEEMTKKDFILPLFEALGWDVYNTHADEVSAEEKVSKGRVDYGFRIEGIPKLFLEAKALKADLEDFKWAEQAINYAWHKGVVWAILTDFESVKVFNAEVKTANPAQSQFFALHTNQFIDRFEQLWLLSRESLASGAINVEAEKWGKKLKKIPVDKQLLADFTSFRELLSKSVLKNNPKKNLTEEDIDESVQRILDRLIFIRTTEDKEIEPPHLMPLLREDANKRIVKKLNVLFRYYDDTYNSKLFQPHLCEDLEIDDHVLEHIIQGLYRSKEWSIHYNFALLDADILGSIYEQYLGHILKKTDKRAKLTEGKAHRKEQGIYYTPTYIVDYIVKNTIGELAKDKKFDMDKIKILDPACGSGSFLIKAFDFLNQYHSKKGTGEQTKIDTSGVSATFSKKLEILKNNIYGVDLDPKAVEIAQLNLLLKAAEKKHRLPTLQENIKCGNSLIDDPNIAPRAFKWEDEFSTIMKNGGFDVVIGNPPWVSLKGKQAIVDISDEELSYLLNKYPCDTYRPNLFEMFIWRAFAVLKEDGCFAFIVPDRLCANKQFENLRKHIMDNFTILKLYFKVSFPGIIGDTIVFILRKSKPKSNSLIEIAEWPSKSFIKIPQKIYAQSSDFAFFYVPKEVLAVFEKIRSDKSIRSLGEIIQTSVGFIAKPDKVSEQRMNDKQISVYKGEDITNFGILKTHYFEFKKDNLAGGTQDKEKLSKKYKVLLRKTGIDLIAAFSEDSEFVEQSLYFLYLEKDDEKLLLYLTGLLNSEIMNCYYRYFGITNRDATPQLKKMDLDKFPIKIPKDITEFTQLIKNICRLENEKNNLEGKKTLRATEIDGQLVELKSKLNNKFFELYDLKQNEIEVVKAALKKVQNVPVQD